MLIDYQYRSALLSIVTSDRRVRESEHGRENRLLARLLEFRSPPTLSANFREC